MANTAAGTEPIICSRVAIATEQRKSGPSTLEMRHAMITPVHRDLPVASAMHGDHQRIIVQWLHHFKFTDESLYLEFLPASNAD
jgi:hypothetical protein